MQSYNSTKIAFLLGSGASIPAGMPSTKDITERVLSGKGVKRNRTKETYFLTDPFYAHESTPDEDVQRVLNFLHGLKVEIDQYYKNQPERLTDYEDLYHVASQIYDSLKGEQDNPAVQPFINNILPQIQPLLVGNEVRQDWELHRLAGEATHYIRDVVWRLLNKEPSLIDHLDSLKDACLDGQLSSVDIFTLNHDIVLERCLSRNGIQVADGFDEPVNDVRHWDPDLLEGRSSKVRLLKLHGSVDWFLYRPYVRDWRVARIPLGLDPHDALNPTAKSRPELLVGTFNKMLQYTSRIYADLHCQFHYSLRHSQRLVICGYGFGDKGINTGIAEWIDSLSDHKIIMVEPNPAELKGRARPAIVKYWDELTIIPKGIEETSWHEIRDRLFKTEINCRRRGE